MKAELIVNNEARGHNGLRTNRRRSKIEEKSNSLVNIYSYHLSKHILRIGPVLHSQTVSRGRNRGWWVEYILQVDKNGATNQTEDQADANCDTQIIGRHGPTSEKTDTEWHKHQPSPIDHWSGSTGARGTVTLWRLCVWRGTGIKCWVLVAACIGWSLRCACVISERIIQDMGPPLVTEMQRSVRSNTSGQQDGSLIEITQDSMSIIPKKVERGLLKWTAL